MIEKLESKDIEGYMQNKRESKMVEESYILICYTNQARKGGWEQVDRSKFKCGLDLIKVVEL